MDTTAAEGPPKENTPVALSAASTSHTISSKPSNLKRKLPASSDVPLEKVLGIDTGLVPLPAKNEASILKQKKQGQGRPAFVSSTSEQESILMSENVFQEVEEETRKISHEIPEEYRQSPIKTEDLDKVKMDIASLVARIEVLENQINKYDDIGELPDDIAFPVDTSSWIQDLEIIDTEIDILEDSIDDIEDHINNIQEQINKNDNTSASPEKQDSTSRRVTWASPLALPGKSAGDDEV